MKKFLFGLATLAIFASCQNETLEQAEFGGIGFENVGIQNATRAITPDDPSYSNSNLMPNFNVYGFFDNNNADLLFDGTVVTVANGTCSYNPIQYWAPGHTYYFQAIAPVSTNWSLEKATTTEDAQKGPGKVTFTNTGIEDLLYAKATTKTEATITAQPEKVGLTFQHLLSKVRFEFVNKFASETYSFEVKGVKITNAEEKAIVDLVNENDHVYTWSDFSGDLVLEFGDVAKLAQGANDYAAKENLLIPYTYKTDDELNVTFDIVLYANASVVDTYTHTVKVPVELLMGYSYNFKAEIDATNVGGDEENALYPIEFTVTGVEGWIPYENDVNIQQTIPAEITTAAELVAAFAQGGSFKLMNNITVPTTLVVEEGTAVTLDLNGQTLTNNSTDLGYGIADVIVVYGQLTIDGEGTVTGPTRCVWARGETNAKVTINGGTYVGATADSFQDVAIYASGNGHVDIYGGEFSTVTIDADSYATDIHSVLNVADKQGTITVYGGKFHNQNPAAAGTEPAGFDNFVAEGYGVINYGEIYEVVGKEITLTEDVKVEGSLFVEGTLDGGNHTVTGAAVPADNGMVRPAGENVTIKNVVLDGNKGVTADGKGIRAIFINDGGNYTLDNVTIKNVTYTINVNTTKKASLKVSNSNLEGWTSYGETTTATFTNVKFTKGTYGNFKPYGQTTVTNCEFTNVNLDFTSLVAPITFVGCKVNGQDLTVDNIANFSEGYEAVKSMVTIK